MTEVPAFDFLTYSLRNQAATITLNRPESYNAFNEGLSQEFMQALRLAAKDPEARAVVLTGAGKAFCSGQDLKDAHGATRSLGASVEKRYNPMIRMIREMPKPFICRLNGVAAGAGASLALACDYVVAAESASLVWAFVNIGLVPDSGSSWFLPRIVGHRKAFELAALGDKISASQAMSLGLINQVVTPAELDEVVDLVVAKFVSKAPISVGWIKQMMNRSFESNLDQMLEMEKNCQEICGRSEDYQEGVAAFVEKRTPDFKGK
jgi:2-(1,2-epoxy-1,2-dihydrophenyl)acetyl-CoA isomerase